jgi:tetratricopeptide (TPR) repeat protein
MVAEETAREITLEGLTSDGVAELVDGLCSPNELEPGFVSKLAADSKGNPLFVVETIRQLVAEGGIVVEGGTHVLAKGAHAIPATIEEVVRRRLDILPPDALAMAEYAACAGEEFDLDAALSAASVADPRAALDELASSGIVSESPRRWRFAHALFQQVVYSGLSPRWLVANHRSLGAHYERTYAGRLDAALFELARHYRGAGEAAKALDYCERAGDKALSELAVERAVEFYGWALSSLPADDASARRWTLTAKLGAAEMRLGEVDAALVAIAEAMEPGRLAGAARLRSAMSQRAALRMKGMFSEAAAAMDAGSDALEGAGLESWAEYSLEWALACLDAGMRDDAVEKIGHVVPRVAELPSHALRSAVYLAEGAVLRSGGDFAPAEGPYRKAVAEAELSGDPATISRAYDILGIFLHHRGMYAEAAQMLKRSLEHSEKAGDIFPMARSLGSLGLVLSDSGDFEGSAACLKRTAALYRRMGYPHGLASALGNLGYTYAVMGRNDDALKHQMESLAIREKLGEKGAIAWSRYDLAIVRENLGLLAKAEEDRRYCLAAWTMETEPMGYATSEIALGNILLGQGKSVEADQLFRSALSHSVSAGLKNAEFGALSGLLRADRTRAGETLPRMERLAAELGDAGLALELGEVKALMALDSGNSSRCISEGEKALEHWRATKERAPDARVADIFMATARARQSTGDLASARRDALEAVRIYKEMGRDWKSARAAELVESLG